MKRLLAGIILAAVVGCDDATGPRPNPSGSLSVVLSGALTYVYDARGARPNRYVPGIVTFVDAEPIPFGASGLAISAVRGLDGGPQDLLYIFLTNATEGSHDLFGSLSLGITPHDPFPEHAFTFISGSVQITARSAGRVQGTFSGVAVRQTSGFPPEPPSDTVIFSMGQFDAPILP